MSVRTCMHFMSHSGGPLPTIGLRPHPSSDTLHLTLVLAEQDFTWSDTAERMRELFTAILAEPLLRALPLPESALPPSPSDSGRTDESGSPSASEGEQSEAKASREAEGAGPTRADQRVRELVGLSPDMQEIADENAYYQSDRQVTATPGVTLKDAKEGVAPELGTCDFDRESRSRLHGRTVVCQNWRPAPAPVETREPLTKEKP